MSDRKSTFLVDTAPGTGYGVCMTPAERLDWERDDIQCAICNRRVPARDAVEGSTLDGELAGRWFCATCAERLEEPPAMPRVVAA